MHAKEFCGKPFLASTDLEEGRDLRLTIEEVKREQVFEPKSREKKTVGIIKFSNHPLRMIFNVTNTVAIISMYGNETNQWKGQQIDVYRTTTRVAGKVVPCLRVRDRAYYDQQKGGQ